MSKRLAEQSGLTASRASLAHLLKARNRQLSTLDERHWTVIGEGHVGAKADELARKAWAIERSGFTLTPRVVLAMGFFDGFLERNGMDKPGKCISDTETLSEAKKAAFSEIERKALWNLVKRFRRDFPSTPLVIRSSAHGDCRGTGIYESVFCPNFRNELKTLRALENAVKRVVLSQFTESAAAFRADLGLPGGMAVIIEPVFGSRMNGRDYFNKINAIIFGPHYSGYAYTSSISCGSYGFIAAGLPIVTARGGGFLIKKGMDQRLWDITKETALDMARTDDRFAFTDLMDNVHVWRSGMWISIRDGRQTSVFRHNETLAMRDYSPDWLFSRLERLERLTGAPQYVEFAMRETSYGAEAAILQIADANEKTDFYAFPQSGSSVISGNFVVGSGRIDCRKAVIVSDPDDIRLLSGFNRSNKGYLVIYGGRLTSIMLGGSTRRLNYADLSNASALVEISEYMHASHPKAHFEGMLEKSEKLLIVTRTIDWERINAIRTNIEKDGATLGVIDAAFRVTASQRQQKGIVEIIEEKT